MVGERANQETIEEIRTQLGADKPLIIQYAGYLRLIAQGELGRSYYTNRRVVQDIKEKFPNTLRLALAAMLFASITGILLGILMGVTRSSFWDRVGSIIAIAGVSVPVFWVGLILMLIFAFTFRVFPPSGMGDGELAYLVLPAATLGINSAAYIARITRSSILDIVSQQYIMTARAKGLPSSRVIFKHMLKNAMIPIITLIGIDFGSYLNGAVLTETIFGWDGIGLYALDGIVKRDYPVVMGTVLVGATVFVLVNMMVDFCYAYLDPRVRVRSRGAE
jgi:ABC-type dipeptide/oligopeptide/nickel transport system permease component